MNPSHPVPTFPRSVTIGLIIVVTVELIIYLLSNGVLLTTTSLWGMVTLGMFYLTYMAFVRRDSLPLVFTILFLTAYHSILFNYRQALPIAVLFGLIFFVNSSFMWLLLHFGTRLPPEHHTAYSLISGFMMAQILTVFASQLHYWPLRFEIVAYVATVFSYFFWRFASLAADGQLNWKQVVRSIILIIILVILIAVGYSTVTV